ncbi:GNAT family N-acetyltransferase [Flavobacterium sp.]|uniref:GNAT family N-acetyltransferase n=1 Tax=Flavobacterium sp. TaxID=239 RepID=UPI00286A24DD|nr:GNAT family N-acetyltransferase [Flavobacterium sp.]
MYKIQEATSEQVPEIVKLWTKLMNIHKEIDAHYFSNTDNSKNDYKLEIESFINDLSDNVYVALIDDKVIGYTTVQLVFFPNNHYNKNSYCTIGDIMIEEDYRHLGIGKDFVEQAKSWSQSYGIRTIQVHVFSKNKKALNFFEQQGFEDRFALLELRI